MPLSLISDPWIPIRYADGTTETIRPSELPGVAEREGVDNPAEFAWGRADLRVATYEFLIGLLAVAVPPDDAAWRRQFEQPLTEADLDAALAPFTPFFELDGEGPRFMQDLEEIAGETLPADALFMDAPGANTLKNGGDLFVKGGRTPVLSRAAAAIAIFALQAFAPSGGAGHRTSLRGGGPMTTLILPPGYGLWGKVWANVARASSPPADNPARVFPWAGPTFTSEGGRTVEQAESGPDDRRWGHPLQAYFGMPRRIRLRFENGGGRRCALTGVTDATVVTGFAMKSYGVSYGPSWRHPLTPYYQPKAGGDELPMHPKSSRVGYRQWVGLLFGDGTTRPAQNITSARDRERSGGLVSVAGYVTDNMKALDYVEADFPLILADDSKAWGALSETANALLNASSIASSALRGAVRAALEVEAGKTLLETPAEAFWGRTEHPFRDALVRIAAGTNTPEQARENWRRVIETEALRAFDQVVPPTSLIGKRPAEQRVIVEARRNLCWTFRGYAKSGGALFKALGLPLPKPKKNEAA